MEQVEALIGVHRLGAAGVILYNEIVGGVIQRITRSHVGILDIIQDLFIIVEVIIPVHAEQADIGNGQIPVRGRFVADEDPVLARAAVQVGVQQRVAQRLAFRLGDQIRFIAVCIMIHVKQLDIRKVFDVLSRADGLDTAEKPRAQGKENAQRGREHSARRELPERFCRSVRFGLSGRFFLFGRSGGPGRLCAVIIVVVVIVNADGAFFLFHDNRSRRQNGQRCRDHDRQFSGAAAEQGGDDGCADIRGAGEFRRVRVDNEIFRLILADILCVNAFHKPDVGRNVDAGARVQTGRVDVRLAAEKHILLFNVPLIRRVVFDHDPALHADDRVRHVDAAA